MQKRLFAKKTFVSSQIAKREIDSHPHSCALMMCQILYTQVGRGARTGQCSHITPTPTLSCFDNRVHEVLQPESLNEHRYERLVHRNLLISFRDKPTKHHIAINHWFSNTHPLQNTIICKQIAFILI